MAKRYKVSVYSKIQLGRQGENLAREIAFDISEWIKEYGTGTAHLLHRRNQEEAMYPVLTKMVGEKVIWVVTSSDVEKAGYSECELRMRFIIFGLTG